MKAVILLLVLVVSGCAHLETDQEREYLAALKAWKGQDINRALEMMGPPAQTFQMPNGRTSYTWVVTSRNGVKTAHMAGMTNRTNFDAFKSCKTTFTTTPEGVVDAIRSEGHCGTGAN